MRLQLGQLRRILCEVDEHVINRVNPESIMSILKHLDARLYEETETFCKELIQSDPDNEIEVIGSQRRLPSDLTFLVCCTFSTMIEFCIEFKMVNNSPFEWTAEFHHGEASGIHEDEEADTLARDQMDSWRDYDAFEEICKDALKPQPDESGRWWADENYYPIRPFVEGETPELKPDPSWTVVDGPTGEVVSE